VLATICILPRPYEGEAVQEEALKDLENEGNRRLALLLGFNRDTPTRTNLLADIISTDILAAASPQIREIYELLEKKFGPLSLKKELLPLLNFVEKIIRP